MHAHTHAQVLRVLKLAFKPLLRRPCYYYVTKSIFFLPHRHRVSLILFFILWLLIMLTHKHNVHYECMWITIIEVTVCFAQGHLSRACWLVEEWCSILYIHACSMYAAPQVQASCLFPKCQFLSEGEIQPWVKTATCDWVCYQGDLPFPGKEWGIIGTVERGMGQIVVNLRKRV